MDEADMDVLRWFEAARAGDEATLERMLSEGFWAEARSPLDGMTALMIAASEGRVGAAMMLASQSEVDARDHWGNTAALVAAAAGREDLVRALLALGADPLARNKAGLDLAKAQAKALARGRLSGG